MSAPHLRDALASLHRERRDGRASLTREAERAIRFKAARPWGVGAMAVAAAGAVIFAVGAGLVSATSADDAAAPVTSGDSRPPNATADATMAPADGEAIPAVVHVPLAGGPQYVHPWGELGCGDPVPTPRPEAPDQRLSIDLAKSEPGPLVTGSLTWSAPETVSTTGREPVIGVGPVLVVAVRDGVVAGMVALLSPTFGWQQFGKGATATAATTLDTEQFLCVTFDEQTQQYAADPVTVDPGTYEVYAVTRVFATPESVALFQALAHTDLVLIDEGLRQEGVTYAPGSPACNALVDQRWAVRACLPDVIPTATLDEDAGTVRMLYDASALPQEFDVTLVSEPLTMVIK